MADPPDLPQGNNEAESAQERKEALLDAIFTVHQHYRDGLMCDIINSEFQAADGFKGDVCLEVLKADLADWQEQIEELGLIYPEDKDIPAIKMLLTDLIADTTHKSVEEGRTLRIDDAFEKLLVHFETELQQANIKKTDLEKGEKISEKFPKLNKTVASLRASGIYPKYVVFGGNDEAKTIVLFLNQHPVNLGKQPLPIQKSQEKLFHAVDKLVDKGRIKNIFSEGLSDKEDVDIALDALKSIKSKEMPDAVMKLKQKYENLEIEATEFSGLHGDLFDTLKAESGHPRQLSLLRTLFLRATVNNMFIAMKISHRAESLKEPVSASVIGTNHEIAKNKQIFTNKDHPLPLSQALAYRGLNVIVVDMSGK